MKTRNNKNGRNRKKKCIELAVLKGLEEQRRKNERKHDYKSNGDGFESGGKVREEVVGFYYDMERKRYFPNEMKKEMRKESELCVWNGLNVLEVILKGREGKN